VRWREILPWFSWWLVMAAGYAACFALCAGAPLTPGILFQMTLANTFGIVALEQLLPGRDANLLRDRQSLNDMGHGVTFAFVGRPLATAGSFALAALLAQHWAGAGRLWPTDAGLLVQVVGATLIWALLDYSFHRAMHTFAPLWWFHALHHDTPQLHLLKSGRLHFGEEMLRYLSFPAVMASLGAPPEVMLWVALWAVFSGNLQHCNMDQRFHDWMHYVLPTVQLHVIHHARERHLQDSNYSGNTPLWDIVFGTFRHPARNPVTRLGLEGGPVPPGFLAQLAYPFRALAQSGAGQARQ
jgi:sterol desaturase/sphingolipid hydroxylase (fatty acid hydroxylase superfamily)